MQLASDVAAAGSARHIILQAETGSADDCIEVTGLNVGEEAILRAYTGHTITLKHNDAGATDKLLLDAGVDFDLSGDRVMKVVKTESGKVCQYVDEQGTGGGGGYTEGARVYHSTTQTINNTTVTPIAFNSERFDTDGIHDNATNNSRLTCQTTGVYVIFATIAWDSNATGERTTLIRLNGTTFIGRQKTLSPGASLVQNVSMIYQLTAGDYIEVCGYQGSGGTRTLDQFAQEYPEFGMQRIG